MEQQDYGLLKEQLAALLSPGRDFLVNSSQFAAFVMQELPGLNWAGFYLLRGGRLHLGPYQGRVACTPLALSTGVCGTAARERRTIMVEDVHVFEGHIACDSASNSELVVPLLRGDELLGVFDLDSPHFGHFGPEEAEGVEALLALFLAATDSPVLPPLI